MKWNIVSTKSLYKYKDQIFDLYKKSYENVPGGALDYGNWWSFSNYLECSCYMLGNTNKITNKISKLSGIIIYIKKKYGNKITIIASENKEIAYEYVIPKLIELLNINGYYAELSDAVEYVIRSKYNVDNIKDIEIIKKVANVKDEDIITSYNDIRASKYALHKEKNILAPIGSYMRYINKELGIKRKSLYGKPCISSKFTTKQCNRKCKNNKNSKNNSIKKYTKNTTKIV